MSSYPPMISMSRTERPTKDTSMLYPSSLPPVSTVKSSFLSIPMFIDRLPEISKDPSVQSLLGRALLTNTINYHIIALFPELKPTRVIQLSDIEKLVLDHTEARRSMLSVHSLLCDLMDNMEDGVHALLPDSAEGYPGTVNVATFSLNRQQHHYHLEVRYRWYPDT